MINAMTRPGWRGLFHRIALAPLAPMDTRIDPWKTLRELFATRASMGEPANSISSLSGVHILLVEDSWPAGTALRNLLRVLGAQVSGPVATAADALRLAAEQSPDAALVDFNLRGGELADRLVEQLHEQGIHVIITTGYTELPRAPRHAVAVLQKPFGEAELIASLRPVIGRKAPLGQA
jgi:CheY-like chemotaxis protein